MKKKDRLVKVADLEAVAHYGEDLVIFIDSEEENDPASLCVLADFNKMEFGPVQPMALYLGLNSYQTIHDGDTQQSYRKYIQEEMNPEVVSTMLHDFTQKHLYNQEIAAYMDSFNRGWLPGG